MACSVLLLFKPAVVRGQIVGIARIFWWVRMGGEFELGDKRTEVALPWRGQQMNVEQALWVDALQRRWKIGVCE